MPVRENPAQVGPAPPAPATAGHATHPPPAVPAVPGVLTAADILATGESIAAVQEPSGAVGWPDGHVDAWNHVECAMALSACGLRGRPGAPTTGSAPASGPTGRGRRRRPPAARSPTRPPRATRPPTSRSGSGTSSWSPGTRRSRRGCGPRCAGASTSCSPCRRPAARSPGSATADGSPAGYALLTGCSSIYQSLRCAVALAEFVGRAAARLGTRGRPARARGGAPSRGVRRQEPVLDGLVLPGPRRAGARAGRGGPAGRGLGRLRGPGPRRPLRQRPALGHRRRDLRARARAGRDRRPRPGRWSCSATSSTCGDADGGYWTGWQFANQAHFPAEHSSWTAAAMILAADALAGATGGAGLFRAASAGRAVLPPADAGACGCALRRSRLSTPRQPRPPPQPARRSARDGWPGPLAGAFQDPQRALARPPR